MRTLRRRTRFDARVNEPIEASFGPPPWGWRGQGRSMDKLHSPGGGRAVVHAAKPPPPSWRDRRTPERATSRYAPRQTTQYRQRSARRRGWRADLEVQVPEYRRNSPSSYEHDWAPDLV